MAESKALAKIKKAEETIKRQREKIKRQGEETKGSVHGGVVIAGAITRPLAAAAAGYADGRIGTEKNQHPVSIVSGVILTTGGAIAAAMGHPSKGAAAVDLGSGPLSGLSWSKAYEAGKAARGAAPAAG